MNTLISKSLAVAVFIGAIQLFGRQADTLEKLREQRKAELRSFGEDVDGPGKGLHGFDIFGAVKEGALDEVSALIGANSNLVFTKDVDGNVPLHLAAMEGREAIVRLLLSKKSDVNAVNNRNTTPISMAAANGFTGVVKILLINKADPNIVNIKGESPLLWATTMDHLEIIELLIQFNANVNTMDTSNRTPLDYAIPHVVDTTEIDLLAQLLVAMSSTSPKHNTLTASQVSAGSSTISHPAAEVLLRRYGAVSMTEFRDTFESKDSTKARAFLLKHPELMSSADAEGMTPLHWAADNGWRDLAEILINAKVDVNAKSLLYRMTPLHWTSAHGSKDVVQLLILNKADVNAMDSSGKTPLRWALDNGFNNVAVLLREHGGRE